MGLDDTAATIRRGVWVTRLVLFVLVLSGLIFFVVENSQEVAVELFFWDTETRLAWALLIAGSLGFVLGLLVPRVRRLF